MRFFQLVVQGRAPHHKYPGETEFIWEILEFGVVATDGEEAAKKLGLILIDPADEWYSNRYEVPQFFKGITWGGWHRMQDAYITLKPTTIVESGEEMERWFKTRLV